MEMVVLIIHLLVCICLIGLVLLQRSEGGALGMGGGGGSLMSGRGAADALAKMTSVAGGFFLVTSLGLTVLSGAAASSTGGSVIDSFRPTQERTVTPPPAAPAPADETTRPDPTESSAPEAAETQLASIVTPAPAASAPRAAPLGPASAAAATPPPRAATTAPRSVPASTTVTPNRTTPAPTTTRTATPPPARSTPATTPTTTADSSRPLVIPNTSGSLTGITLSDDAQSQPESIEIGGGGVEAVRRERAGPDQ